MLIAMDYIDDTMIMHDYYIVDIFWWQAGYHRLNASAAGR